MANDFTSAYLKRRKQLVSPAGLAEQSKLKLGQAAQVAGKKSSAASAFKPKTQLNSSLFPDTPRAENNTFFDVDPGKIGTGKIGAGIFIFLIFSFTLNSSSLISINPVS